MFRVYILVWMLFLLPLGSHLSADYAEPTPAFTVEVPMRDGTTLPTDIYQPEERSGKLPCVLVRSPAGRNAYPWKASAYLSGKGYVVALQGTRSSMDGEGKTFPFLHDGWGDHQDGYDSVEWLAKRPWCDGRVVTAGVSAAGITQLMLAPAAPPSLAGQHVGMAASSLYDHATYPGGQLSKNQVEGWLGLYAKDPSVLESVCREKRYNDFWHKFNSVSGAEKVNVPALFYTGWYDTFLQGTLDAFHARQEQGREGARGRQKLVIGPWTHFWPHDMKLGDFVVPEGGRQPPWDISPHIWFDALLHEDKAMDNAIPAVTYYVMGSFAGEESHGGHRWKGAASWPPRSQERHWFLSADGTLAEDQGRASAGRRHYCHDDESPVPTLGGCNLFLEAGPKDQSSLGERDDVLVYTSEPLETEVEIAGKCKALLWCATKLKEYDLDVRLCDLYPDGRSVLVCEGLVHVHRVTANEAAELHEVPLWDTAIVFAKGHRLRILVSSSNYPRYECPSSDGAKPKPHVTLFSGEATPSQLILPVVAEEEEDGDRRSGHSGGRTGYASFKGLPVP